MDPMLTELKFAEITKTPEKSLGLFLKSAPFTNFPVISAVEKGSLADGAGLKENDVILAVNRRRVFSVAQTETILEGEGQLRIVIARLRLEPLQPDMIRPFNRARDPNCVYKLIRVDPGSGGNTLGLRFGLHGGKLSISEMKEGWGSKAKLRVYDRPLAIGETEVTTSNEIIAIVDTAGGEPTDWTIKGQLVLVL